MEQFDFRKSCYFFPRLQSTATAYLQYTTYLCGIRSEGATSLVLWGQGQSKSL